MAQAGEVKLALPWIPGLGKAGQPRPAAIRFEDGTVLAEGMPGYPPKAAIWGL